jgi:hypothetical protein
MAVIGTQNPLFSNVVKQELFPEIAYCRAVVTVNDDAATLKVGTVLGKVTIGGKYKVAVETASDGSKVADAVVIQEITVPASTDTNVVVLIKGPAAVSKGGLILDSTYDSDAKKLAVYTALEAKGIKVLETV